MKVRRLYNYQPFKADWLSKILSDDVLHCTNPENFNDPWDCRPCFSIAVIDNPAIYEQHVQFFDRADRKLHPKSEEEHRRTADRMRTDRSFLESLIRQASEIETLIQARYRVYCLTTKPDSVLMWSHYADRHRGICLEFDTVNTVFSAALKVEYLNESPPLDLSDNAAPTILLPLMTKSAAWSYEGEYRLIAEEKSAASGHNTLIAENGFLTFPRDALKSVIVGCSVPDAAREEIRRIVNRSGHTLALKMARRIPNRFALAIEP